MIRQQWPGLERFLKKSGKYLPVADLGLQPATDKVVCLAAIQFKMEQQGLTPKDLEPYIGPSGRVSEVLNRKCRLSLQMIKRLHQGLHIPYESLLAAV
jgi:antitoxin component HigA of HigAB toxin-antitoxin module